VSRGASRAEHATSALSTMRLYNTLSRQEEPFVPLDGRTVRMYTCGLTVYARGHVGNFRTFVALDVLRRTLRHQEGYAVRQVMNFTDVDDRTIAAARAAGMPLRDYTDRWIAAFREDAAALGLEPVEENPRATDAENLQAMCALIQALEANGHTYRTEGSIYFKIATLSDYGKLARLDHAGIKAGARIDADKYEKEDARDFVLWKATAAGEPTWDFGVGPGRPGWHIECSAMARRLLGDTIDIHAGGVDLIFPHHENEIAQSEGATGRPFARFWVHVEHLLVDDGEKMSKSLGNVFTVQNILEQGYRASALRYLLMSVHYRKQLRFSWASLDQAEEALKRLFDFLARLDVVTRGEAHEAVQQRVAEARAEFGGRLADDLNVPGALGVVFDLVRAMNVLLDQGQVGAPDVTVIREAFAAFDRVLGVIALRRAEEAAPPVPLAEIEQLVAARQAARRGRDFQEADRIRKDLEARGILLEDTPGGTRWKRG
jgi:cysteinyl-tRNA synthetase